MRHDPRLDDYAAGWEPLDLQPWRVRLIPVEPVAGQDALHLDGLLAAGLVELATAGAGLAPSAEPYHLPLPLACLWRDRGGLPLWATTDFRPVGQPLWGRATWRKFNPPPVLIRSTQRGHAVALSDGRGPDKMLELQAPTVLAPAFEADVIGDRKRVADLLAALGAHVGKRRGKGWGRIDRWEIEPLPGRGPVWAYFSVLDVTGQLRRPVPVACFSHEDQHDLALLAQWGGWTPPYWRGAGTQALVVPAGIIPGVPIPAVFRRVAQQSIGR